MPQKSYDIDAAGKPPIRVPHEETWTTIDEIVQLEGRETVAKCANGNVAILVAAAPAMAQLLLELRETSDRREQIESVLRVAGVLQQISL